MEKVYLYNIYGEDYDYECSDYRSQLAYSTKDFTDDELNQIVKEWDEKLHAIEAKIRDLIGLRSKQLHQQIIDEYGLKLSDSKRFIKLLFANDTKAKRKYLRGLDSWVKQMRIRRHFTLKTYKKNLAKGQKPYYCSDKTGDVRATVKNIYQQFLQNEALFKFLNWDNTEIENLQIAFVELGLSYKGLNLVNVKNIESELNFARILKDRALDAEEKQFYME